MMALIGGVFMAAPVSVFAQSRPTAAATVIDDALIYRMKRGDNLYALAQKHMISPAAVPQIQRYNRFRNPNVLPVGTVVRIPVRLLKYQPESVRLAAWRGTVNIGGNGQPTAGMILPEGATITTGQGGFVTLLLANGSRISIPSQTVVRIARMRQYTINQALDYEFAVDKGRVQTKATPLKNPESRYRIRTPIAVSAVRGTEFRVKLNSGDAPSLTEVLEGTVAVGPLGATASTAVPQGTGIGVSTNGESRTEKLLPAPELTSPGKVQKEPELSFAITPVTGAARYRAVFATDATMTEQFAEAESDTPVITSPAIPNGKYFVRISALSPAGFEGFSTSYGFARRLSTVAASSAPADDGSVTFKWDADGEGKIVHRFQLYRDSIETTPVIDETGLNRSEIKLDNLPPGTWFWRIGISVYGDATVTDNWTSPEKLIIAREE